MTFEFNYMIWSTNIYIVLPLNIRNNDLFLQHLNCENNSPDSKELNASSRKSPTGIDFKTLQKQPLANLLQNRCSSKFRIIHRKTAKKSNTGVFL